MISQSRDHLHMCPAFEIGVFPRQAFLHAGLAYSPRLPSSPPSLFHCFSPPSGILCKHLSSISGASLHADLCSMLGAVPSLPPPATHICTHAFSASSFVALSLLYSGAVQHFPPAASNCSRTGFAFFRCKRSYDVPFPLDSLFAILFDLSAILYRPRLLTCLVKLS